MNTDEMRRMSSERMTKTRLRMGEKTLERIKLVDLTGVPPRKHNSHIAGVLGMHVQTVWRLRKKHQIR